MKTTNIIILLLFVSVCSAQTNNLELIRKSYLESNKSKENINNLISLCERYKNKDSLIINAYKTVADLMLIKYKNNPFHKLNLFVNKTKKLDILVNNNLNNIEIRFLRYCVQKQSPKFLAYRDDLELDYQFIIKNIDTQSIELQEYINLTLNKSK